MRPEGFGGRNTTSQPTNNCNFSVGYCLFRLNTKFIFSLALCVVHLGQFVQRLLMTLRLKTKSEFLINISELIFSSHAKIISALRLSVSILDNLQRNAVYTLHTVWSFSPLIFAVSRDLALLHLVHDSCHCFLVL